MEDQSTEASVASVASVVCGKLGIIADSHGRPQTIADGINFLRGQGCTRIYHLGDICDSFLPETADACVQLLQHDDISAVKGNNDHAVVVNHLGWENGLVSQETLAYLQALPPMLAPGNGVFAHSLPFVQELGLSSMIRELKAEWARRFFSEYPREILFRGHSHEPEITGLTDTGIATEPMSPGQTIDLATRPSCIVTCGALTHGLCTIWDMDQKQLSCISFR
ncbi:MAG: metallophosphoesterase family protein [Desulfobacterales bacterium]